MRQKSKAARNALIYGLLRLHGFSASAAGLLVKLANLETGYYTSKLWRVGRNPWGMSLPKQRPTTAKAGHILDDGNTGAYYSSLFQAVRDMSMYFDFFKYSKTEIPELFWRRYNPSERYEIAVRSVPCDARRDFHTFALVVAPLSFILIRIIWNYSRNLVQ